MASYHCEELVSIYMNCNNPHQDKYNEANDLEKFLYENDYIDILSNGKDLSKALKIINKIMLKFSDDNMIYDEKGLYY